MELDLDNSRPQEVGKPWGPIGRALAGGAGLALLTLGTHRRRPFDWVFGAVGVGLLVRAASAAPSARLVSSGRDPYAFEARRSIRVERPVAEAFALLSDYAHYPDFMPTVRAMEILPGLRHRWKMVGPGGVEIPVRDVITQLVPNRFVAWESEPESTLPYAGAALFVADGPGTIIHARMSYGPPLGAVGDTLARVLGQDPGHQLQEILTRARDYLASGRFQSARSTAL